MKSDAEITELQHTPGRDQHVSGSNVAMDGAGRMNQLDGARQTRDLTRRPRLRPRHGTFPEMPSEIAALRKLRHETIQRPSMFALRHPCKRLVHADDAGLPSQQLAKIRFTMPALRVGGDLQHTAARQSGTAHLRRTIRSAEPAAAEEVFHPILAAAVWVPDNRSSRQMRAGILPRLGAASPRHP